MGVPLDCIALSVVSIQNDLRCYFVFFDVVGVEDVDRAERGPGCYEILLVGVVPGPIDLAFVGDFMHDLYFQLHDIFVLPNGLRFVEFV